MNRAGAAGTPFLFGVDFELTRGFFIENPLRQSFLRFAVPGAGNLPVTTPGAVSPDFSAGIRTGEEPYRMERTGGRDSEPGSLLLKTFPGGYASYSEKFGIVRDGLLRGDTFLLNLTGRTRVETSLSFETIAMGCWAPYRLLFPGRFVCFSPECFVRIEGRKIASFPMKGTAEADRPCARELLLNSYKEVCEHYTIVDLIRNDLSRVARRVRVPRFRYVEEVVTRRGLLLQTSSEVAGELPPRFERRLGDIVFELLPAGSVSGAPKPSTLRIIRRAEKEPRGYYSGVFGYWDGRVLESAVMIRFIELDAGKTYFRSGGGITVHSDPREEYREMIDKIYLPAGL